MILVTGTPRSGTLTVSWLLRRHGYDCPHEKMGNDGTVSCYYTAKWDYIPWAGKNLSPHEGEQFVDRTDFRTKVLLVRHPLPCIASMSMIVNYPHIEWMQEHGLIPVDLPAEKTRKNKIHKLMHAWVGTYERFADYKILRTEHLRKDWNKCFQWELQHPVPRMHKSSGYRKAPKFTWRDLHMIDKELTERIREKADALNL